MSGARRSRFVEYIDESTGRRFRVDFQYTISAAGKQIKKPAILEQLPGGYWQESKEPVAGTPVSQREFKNRTEAQKVLDLLSKARGWKAVTE